MELILWPTCEHCASEILDTYLDKIGNTHQIQDKNELKSVYIGLIAVSEYFKQFESLGPRMSFKSRSWEVSVFLDIDKVCSTKTLFDLEQYIKKKICERMDELKMQKTLRGIKDRSMLEDIKNYIVNLSIDN